MTPQTFLQLTEQGIYRYRPERVVDPEALLKAIGGAACMVTHNIADLNGNPVGMQIRGSGAITYGVTIPSVSLTTWFAPATDTDGVTYITPVYKETTLSVKQTRVWNAPSDFRLWFFYGEGGDNDKRAYIVMQHLTTRRCYKPPFSNIFDDSRICMGGSWNPPDSPSGVEKLRQALAHFQTAESNNDLIGDTGGGAGGLATSSAMLRWQPSDDGAQIDSPVGDYIGTLRSVSHHAWEKIVSS